MLKSKSIHETIEDNDSYRILIDNECSANKFEKSEINLWMKDITPSKELSSLFKNNLKWDEFEKKYLKELEDKKKIINELKIITQFNKKVTLLYVTGNKNHNIAVILLKLLKKPSKQVRSGIFRIHG
ncbi:MAG: DUF488 family protein [Methanobacterium sp.]|nr:DUF488 family protein [Methanobacterium sp.]